MIPSSKQRAQTRVEESLVRWFVVSSALWWATPLAIGCANATSEPAEARSSSDGGPSDGSTAGQPNDTAPTASAPTWCDARAVLESYCQRCHGDEPAYGAPFPLMTYEDVHARNKKGRPRYEAIALALENERMPPSYLELEPPVSTLPADERALLLDWCALAAPGDGSDECPTAE